MTHEAINQCYRSDQLDAAIDRGDRFENRLRAERIELTTIALGLYQVAEVFLSEMEKRTIPIPEGAKRQIGDLYLRMGRYEQGVAAWDALYLHPAQEPTLPAIADESEDTEQEESEP